MMALVDDSTVVNRLYKPPFVADDTIDGSSSPPSVEVGRQSTNSTPIAACQFTEEPETVERGRSLERGPRYPNPLARAESCRRNAAAIEVDGRPILKRPRFVAFTLIPHLV